MLLGVVACSTQIKMDRLRKQPLGAEISPADEPALREFKTESVSPDTLRIIDPEGKEVLVMKAVKDENGETVMVAELQAAVVRSRFRNVAERHGRVDLRFDVSVPSDIQDSRWQLRFRPKMICGDRTEELDQVNITGHQYRAAQLRGYQRYEHFLSSIITDSTAFIRQRDLETFLKRNMPDLYDLKRDSSFVSEEKFASMYGITRQEAVEHYKDHLRERANRKRLSRKDRMYSRYIKVPILSEGIRLDTMLVSSDGEFVYQYIQTVKAMPGLRRIDIMLDGEIYEEDKLLYSMPAAGPLTFYISSLSAFVDDTPRYLSKVIERRSCTTHSCRLDFEKGSSTLDPGLGENQSGIDDIKKALGRYAYDPEFHLDSVCITASCSPDGSYRLNSELSRSRGNAVTEYFRSQMPDSLTFICHENPENWAGLERLVRADTSLTGRDLKDFEASMAVADPDLRERALCQKSSYPYIAAKLYPKLRSVSFDFHLSRRWMDKDTVHTTVPDTLYMAGIQAIKDCLYEDAIKILTPYADFNTAVALCAADRNHTALSVLEDLPVSGKSEYLMAVLHSRMGEDAPAVQHYLNACAIDHTYVHRGNLDPEISELIKKYQLNTE